MPNLFSVVVLLLLGLVSSCRNCILSQIPARGGFMSPNRVMLPRRDRRYKLMVEEETEEVGGRFDGSADTVEGGGFMMIGLGRKKRSKTLQQWQHWHR